MRYRLALLPFLGSLVAALPTNLEKENKNSIMLPNAFMVYDVLAIPEGGEYDWRVKYVDLVAPRIGACVSQNEECSALGVHSNPRRRYFMRIGSSPISEREGRLTFEVELTSAAITGESYAGSGTITVECNEDECTSNDRFFLQIGNVPYTTYVDGSQQ